MKAPEHLTLESVRNIYESPVLDLIYRAAGVHRQYHDPKEVQQCTLLSVKTGGCPEDCAYCPQSAHYKTAVAKEDLLDVKTVLHFAKTAKENGSTRFCMGAAWRDVKDGKDFDQVLEMVRGVNQMGLEVCVTLGMLTEQQAVRLKEAGLFAYNHNLDTGEDFYDKVITTRSYQERIETVKNVAKAGISVCCGGILGMGESHGDRIQLLHTLATLPTPPESVPINALVRVPGTPLANEERVPIWDMIRMIATARILLPKAMVRLSAGRLDMPITEQALCFLAGANSIFTGDRLLTTPNPKFDQDSMMFELFGLKGRPSFKQRETQPHTPAQAVRA